MKLTDEEITIIANKIAVILLEKEAERDKERAKQMIDYLWNTPFDRGMK